VNLKISLHHRGLVPLPYLCDTKQQPEKEPSATPSPIITTIPLTTILSSSLPRFDTTTTVSSVAPPSWFRASPPFQTKPCTSTFYHRHSFFIFATTNRNRRDPASHSCLRRIIIVSLFFFYYFQNMFSNKK